MFSQANNRLSMICRLTQSTSRPTALGMPRKVKFNRAGGIHGRNRRLRRHQGRRQKLQFASKSETEDDTPVVTFLHKVISHKWIVDEQTQEIDWFIGKCFMLTASGFFEVFPDFTLLS